MGKSAIRKTAWKGVALAGCALLASCAQESGPNGPTCDNRTTGAMACGDCNAANPEHKACYDAFTYEVYPILESRCIGCHSSGGLGEFLTGGEDAGLNMEQALVYQRLLMPSFGDSGATRRIVPGRPDSSSLYDKIISVDVPPWFGSSMPQGNALINTDPLAVAAIRQWILLGAKPPAANSAYSRDSARSAKSAKTAQISKSRGG
jgi:hypothetical protein